MARVLCPAGDHLHGVLVDPSELLRLAEPRVAEVCERSAGELDLLVIGSRRQAGGTAMRHGG